MSYTGSIPDTLDRPDDWLRTPAPCKADPEAMFATSAWGVEQAKRICDGCSVIEECLQWALENREEYGTWGGLSEADRRRLLRRRSRKVKQPVEEEAPRPVRTFQSVYDERTVALQDGHRSWTGAHPVSVDHRYYTPKQIAFRVDRGRPPVGVVRRTCEREGCVLPGHLTDQAERNGQQAPASPAEQVSRTGRPPAPCGTRSAYQRHVKKGEPIDDACRRANTVADRRLRATGSTKALR
ncbi:WhiB family transcriptional regulator [Streptomyces chartreusis]|uniref:WhiB family transcriptional regulator n=1 Tax=Streptomyces chartreusis TaxID=1969 RepID=UPI00342C0298